MTDSTHRRRNFLHEIIDADLDSGRHDRVATRFPPEPNGYLHIGHAKSICLNFGLARDFGGVCHLRFDDTNPEAEEEEYVRSIQHDIRWLGFDWGEHLFFASDFFEQMYAGAEKLICDGKAYVDSLDAEQISAYRGTLTEAGRPSPDRDRPMEESLDLFRRMRAGEFADGEYVLRARIDLAASNMKMRDPLLYRIRHAHHHRTGDAWCIYPMYDYAHCLEDAFEGITHSICTLEFENNRALYDWVVEHTGQPWVPRQYEFARLFLNYTVMSKRKLLRLVDEGHVSGWDDPRMPTLAAYRRGGVPAGAIRRFCDEIGVTKNNTMVDVGRLEHAIRDTLNHVAPRVMCVTRPLKVVLTNYPAGQVELLDAPYWPRDVPKEGSRAVPFARELYIERDDFAENPPKGFYRLAPGREVRLRYGYVIRCDEVVRDFEGQVSTLRCTYDPDTRGGQIPDGRKVPGTIHWVARQTALPCEIRLYDRLFASDRPGAGGRDLLEDLNPDSLHVLHGYVEPSVATDDPDTRYQFERVGYFWRDPVDGRGDDLVFNRTVPLRDSWAKQQLAPQDTREATPTSRKRADTRPTKRTAAEIRAEARARDPSLAAAMDALVARGLSSEDADVLSAGQDLARFASAALDAHDAPSTARWMTNVLLAELKDADVADIATDGAAFGRLVALVDEGALSTTAAKEVLAELLTAGGEPAEILERRGLRQVSDTDALVAEIEAVLAANPGELASYRDGKTQLFGFFVGQVMRGSGGNANPKLVQQLLRERL